MLKRYHEQKQKSIYEFSTIMYMYTYKTPISVITFNQPWASNLSKTRNYDSSAFIEAYNKSYSRQGFWLVI